MPPPPIAETTRYIPDGVTRIYLVETITTITAPSRSEIDAGLDVTAEVADVIGWHLSAALIDMQGVNEVFRSQMDGSLQVDDSRLVLYASEDGGDAATVLDRGDDTHVVFLHGGDIEGNPMDVWPVRLAARTRMIRVGGEPVRLDHQFVVTAEPALDVPVPAHP